MKSKLSLIGGLTVYILLSIFVTMEAPSLFEASYRLNLFRSQKAASLSLQKRVSEQKVILAELYSNARKSWSQFRVQGESVASTPAKVSSKNLPRIGSAPNDLP